jgi:hypothetical protein
MFMGSNQQSVLSRELPASIHQQPSLSDYVILSGGALHLRAGVEGSAVRLIRKLVYTSRAVPVGTLSLH